MPLVNKPHVHHHSQHSTDSFGNFILNLSALRIWTSTNHSHTSTCFKVVQFRKESSTDSDLGGPLLCTGLGSYPLHAWYMNTPIRSPNLCSTSQPCDFNLSTQSLSDLKSVLNSYVVKVSTHGLMKFFCFGAHA